MNNLKLSIIFTSMALLVIGCSKLDKLNGSDEYKTSVPHDNRLIIPKDLNRNTVENYYPIPDVKSDAKESQVLTVPPGSKI